MSRSKAVSAGLLAGLIAGIAMTVVMLVLACFGVATPLAIIGDRLSVSHATGSWGRKRRVYARNWTARVNPGRTGRADCRRRRRVVKETLSHRHVQLRRNSIQRPHRPTDHA